MYGIFSFIGSIQPILISSIKTAHCYKHNSLSMRLLRSLKTREAALEASHLESRHPVPGNLYFYRQIENIISYLKKGDFMKGLSKIRKLIFVFPKPFLWLQVMFFPLRIQRHQVRKIRLSNLLKLLELTPCRGQNMFTSKMKTAIEDFQDQQTQSGFLAVRMQRTVCLESFVFTVCL